MKKTVGFAILEALLGGYLLNWVFSTFGVKAFALTFILFLLIIARQF